jgi:DNA (cytosine-5)-methyltransferase 1
LNFGSVCSGIEAASMAWNPLGWRTQFVSEIDRFPCELLKVRHPDVPNFGDMTPFHEWPDANLDVLVGGTPCQSFSVAGLRKGLDDPRGNLMLTYLAIAARYRPRWLVWENVPGVLSSGEGRDFGSLLGGLAELGYGFAYRVLDAQYFHLAQRRERVFVVGCLGGWQRAAAVLFERSSLRGDIAPRREAGKGVAAPITPGSRDGSGYRNDPDTSENLISHPLLGKGNSSHDSTMETYVAHALNAKGGSGRSDLESETLISHALRAEGFDASEDGTGRGTPLVPVISPPLLAGGNSTGGPRYPGTNVDTCESLIPIAFNARQDPSAGAIAGPIDTDGTTQAIAFSCKDHGADAAEVSPTLRAMNHSGSHANAGGQVAVAFAQNQRDEVREMPIAGALASEPGMKQQTYLAQHMAVRRLTPRECERLQGFPTVIDRITVTACLDHRNDRVTVALQCRKLPDSAPDVGGDASGASASRADIRLQNDQESRESLVAVHVRTSFEPRVAAIRSHGRWFLSASDAASERWSLPLAPQGSFARSLAALPLGLALAMSDGKAESHQSTLSFTLPAHGRWRAAMFGDESMAVASAVESARTEATTFIMSNRGRGTLPCGSIDQTSFCFVLDAIALCIPERTKRANSFSAVIDVESDYTAIEYRGKPAADGPRYKVLGNSMAVTVMRWIGRRIALVHRLPHANVVEQSATAEVA